MNWFRHLLSSLSILKAGPRLEDGHDHGPDQAWSLSARLAAVSDLYLMIIPSDLADLVREAKQLHPEVAYHASRRDDAVKQWVQSAQPQKTRN